MVYYHILVYIMEEIFNPNQYEKEFEKYLCNKKIIPEDYIATVKNICKANGYDPELIKFSNNSLYKLEYDNIPFGLISHGDDMIINRYYQVFGKIDETQFLRKIYYYKKIYSSRINKIDKNILKNPKHPETLYLSILWSQ